MHRTILIAATPDDAGRAALALGVALARPIGAQLVIAGIATGRYDMPADEAARAELMQPLLAGVPADLHATLEVLDSDTVKHGLQQLVAEHDAAILVVGPSHRSILGRTLSGDVALAASSGGSCAVAVAPALPATAALRRMAVAWDGTPAADEALEWTVQLAERAGAEVELVRVHDARHPEGTVPEDGTAERTKAVAEAARRRAAVTPRLVWGDPAEALLALSHDTDLLVVGSRPRGRIRRALLGGVSTELVHHAHCPVVVIPAGVHAPSDTAAV
jgi:nucleotide-binding universal stress UspA family protein